MVMKCFRAWVRHKNKLRKIIKKDRTVSMLLCLLWSINNFSNAVNIIHLYVTSGDIKDLRFVSTWLPPQPLSLTFMVAQLPLCSALPALSGSCVLPWHHYSAWRKDGHCAIGFSEARILLELGAAFWPCLAVQPCLLLLPEQQREASGSRLCFSFLKLLDTSSNEPWCGSGWRNAVETYWSENLNEWAEWAEGFCPEEYSDSINCHNRPLQWNVSSNQGSK